MPRYTYEVRYGSTPTVLTNVQSFSITKGRAQVQDPFKAGTATISGRVPSSLPSITVGTKIEIWCTNLSPANWVFKGTVADYKINYGITSSMDTWEIQCEDSFAGFGRALSSPSAGWASGATTYSAASTMASGAGLVLTDVAGALSTSQMSAQSLPNTNVMQVLQQIIFTEQGRLVNLGLSSGKPALGWISRLAIGAFPTIGAFTDGTVATALSKAPFDVVQFYSQSDSYYEEVVIKPSGLADQIVGSGTRVFTGNSYDVSTAQAANLAGYVLGTLTINNAVPQSISCVSENQTTDVAINSFISAGDGSPCQLILRGVTYDLLVEGGTMTADPQQTRWTFNTVSNTAVGGFVLDSATLGVLDQNKLGF